MSVGPQSGSHPILQPCSCNGQCIPVVVTTGGQNISACWKPAVGPDGSNEMDLCLPAGVALNVGASMTVTWHNEDGTAVTDTGQVAPGDWNGTYDFVIPTPHGNLA